LTSTIVAALTFYITQSSMSCGVHKILHRLTETTGPYEVITVTMKSKQ